MRLPCGNPLPLYRLIDENPDGPHSRIDIVTPSAAFGGDRVYAFEMNGRAAGFEPPP